MTLGDYVGFGLTVGFGLWWVLFPNSVVRFYAWFHSGRVEPKASQVRAAGACWIALVLVVTMLTFKRL